MFNLSLILLECSMIHVQIFWSMILISQLFYLNIAIIYVQILELVNHVLHTSLEFCECQVNNLALSGEVEGIASNCSMLELFNQLNNSLWIQIMINFPKANDAPPLTTIELDSCVLNNQICFAPILCPSLYPHCCPTQWDNFTALKACHYSSKSKPTHNWTMLDRV